VVLHENPDILLFPVGTAEGISESEQQAWRKWSTLTAVKRNNLRQIPADLLNRPGPRIGKALELLADLFHPSATSLPSESH
jgi:iron complex transport system substrate-binding protein